MSGKSDTGVSEIPGPVSPNGALVIPRWLTPYFLTAASICTLLAGQFALPGPWTPDRYFSMGAAILSMLVGGVSGGLGKTRD